MEQQKQIEEMSAIMADCDTNCDECFKRLEAVMTLPIANRADHCQAYLFAQRAFEAGYRKIPEGSVVVDKEYLKKELQGLELQVRKETAKEIFQQIKHALDEYRLDNEYFTEDDPYGNLWKMNSSVFYLEVVDNGGLIDQLAQKYGVEVEE